MQEFFERIDVFRNIMYDDAYHSYTINGIKTVSVTKVTGAAKPPFDEQKAAESTVAKRAAQGDMVTVTQVLAEWKMNNLVSTLKGSAAHKYLESALANKFERFPYADVKREFDKFRKELPTKYPDVTIDQTYRVEDSIRGKYDAVIRLMDRFKRDIAGRMVPIKSELVIGHPDYLICGMIDQVFWNHKSGQFELWDWKTNSKFETSSKYRLLDPVSHLTKCQLDEYSLQLACYKKIFTERTGIPLGTSHLCWFCETEEKYHVYDCKELPNEATALIKQSMDMRNIKHD